MCDMMSEKKRHCMASAPLSIGPVDTGASALR